MEKFKKNIKRVLGFRSGTPWKSVVAALYYAVCLFVLFMGAFTPPPVAANLWDTAVMKFSLLVIFLWMLSPALFLSDTPLRKRLPFLKKNTLLDSAVGMVIVFVIFSYLFALSESFHIAEYKQRYRQYRMETVTAQITESSGDGQAR